MANYFDARIIPALTEKLFEAEERRLGAIITTFNRKNKQLTDAKIDGFLYLGKLYVPKDISVVRSVGRVTPALHFSMNDEMAAFLVDQKQVSDEKHMISQILFMLLSPCQTQQNIRDALPECLISCLPYLARYPRDQEAAWTLINKPWAMKQYEKYLPMMEIYSACKLIY